MTRRSERVSGTGRALLLLALLPWALLTAAGGIHNHGFAGAGQQTAVECRDPVGTTGLHQGRIAGSDTRCLACLWQLQSGATSNGASDTPAEPVIPSGVSACEAAPGRTDALNFDPRAPPLS